MVMIGVFSNDERVNYRRSDEGVDSLGANPEACALIDWWLGAQHEHRPPLGLLRYEVN
jgi:hypothetical protein